MDVLTGLTLLLLCQAAGEAVTRLVHLPLPGPVLGLVLMALLLQWPAVRKPVQAAATPLLNHLSLLFVPVGVGVVSHLGLIAQHGAGMLLAVVLSTWVGLLVAAWVLRALWVQPAAGGGDAAIVGAPGDQVVPGSQPGAPR
jgi:holin-like protein